MKETIPEEEESKEKEEKGNKEGLEVSSDEEDGGDDKEQVKCIHDRKIIGSQVKKKYCLLRSFVDN